MDTKIIEWKYYMQGSNKIKKLRKQLNAVNKVFAQQITKNKYTSDRYTNIGIKYQKIIEFVKKNSTSEHPALEIYKLSATLGLFQCQVNAFDLLPFTEEAVKKKDEQLANFKEEILNLLTLTAMLKTKFNLEADTAENEDHPIKDEYITLEKQIVDYNNAWETTEFNLKAAYYYNYADHLLSKPGPARLIKKAIPFFKQSSDFYSKNNKKIEKKQTDDKIVDILIKLPVRQSQVSLNKLTSSDIQSMKSLIAINRKRAMTLDTKQKNIPPKKRKINLTQITQTTFLSNVLDGKSTQTHAEISCIKMAIVKNTLRIITNYLSHLPSESEHHFLENLLQTIKAFYMSSDKAQQDWLEENGIPIKPSNIHYQNFLGKLYNLINLFSPGNVNFVENSNGISRIHFFQPKKTLLTKEIFLARLKNHLLMLRRDYVNSNNKYYKIGYALTQLIRNQVGPQYMTEQNNVSSTYHHKILKK